MPKDHYEMRDPLLLEVDWWIDRQQNEIQLVRLRDPDTAGSSFQRLRYIIVRNHTPFATLHIADYLRLGRFNREIWVCAGSLLCGSVRRRVILARGVEAIMIRIGLGANSVLGISGRF